ncbi:hypothetical protein [Mesorhizobium sp.]|uniref:hypothetical protein n=1 Tax=Mesorhizobium sp. TaxID=1871066 RepID=UPI000FE55B7A|nr:hypothetical protein [Mesorhizobium sp.]RWO08226.1 MAG: hypothetical protein EOS15_29880 [Mesorhizobium sp.]
MADITITASAVLASSTATVENGTAGAAVTAGQTVYLSPTTGKYELADADGAADLRRPRGIALHSAGIGQPLRIHKEGDLTMDGLTAGVTYYQSPNPGGIAPRADVLTGDYVTVIGVAKSTTVLAVDIQFPNVASA